MTETHSEVLSAYPPAAEFAEQANATAALYDEAEADRLAFWATQANRLSWAKPFTEVLDWSAAPFAKWFADGKLNVAYNCVDRHVEAGNGLADHHVVEDEAEVRFVHSEEGLHRFGGEPDLAADKSRPGGEAACEIELLHRVRIGEV